MKRKWLAIGIILLFVGTCFIPAIAQNTEKSQSSRGNWLYVGGRGPGNYTRIQDAIDNAQPGDTLFVYDDSSPYLESLRIRKSRHFITNAGVGFLITFEEEVNRNHTHFSTLPDV